MIRLQIIILVLMVWVSLMANPHSILANKEDLQQGQVLVVVFKDGIPASDVAIKTSNGVLKTNSQGVISVLLPTGSNQTLKVLKTNQTFNVKVIKDQETQVVIDLKDSKGVVDIKTPRPLEDDVKVSLSNSAKQLIQLTVTTTTHKPVSDATVLFSGIDTVYRTDIKGQVITELPLGTYSIGVFHTDYQTLNLPEVTLEALNKKSIKANLERKKNQLEDVVVLAPKVKGNLSTLVETRKQSSAVTDVLGSEQMTRAGDSDAASSLRRVTGLTLVGGKYVYVRGLGERYSGVQMNSFSLPSPEPARRVVPLDLFPTSVMESIVVQKSYSPDLPAEFGGGLIQLQTKSLPEKFFFKSSLSTTYETAGSGLAYAGGGLDWLGMDDGTRSMPASIQSAIRQGRALEVNTVGFEGGVSEAELIEMSQSLSNNYELNNTAQDQALPSLSISTGNGWKMSHEDIGQIKAGTSASLLYGQSTDQLIRDSKSLVVASGDDLVLDSKQRSDYTEIETRLAGSFDFGIEINKNHKLTANTFVLRNTTNLAQLSRTEFISGNPTDSVTMDFVERELWTRHLKGEHKLGKINDIPIQMDWRWGFADATRDSLDRRELSYDVSGVDQSLLNDSTRRSYSELLDVSEERALNFTIPIAKDSRDFIKIKFGLLSLDRQRDSSMNRLMFVNKDPSVNYNSANSAYSSQNMGSGFVLNNISANSTQADNYSGVQSVNAQYAMMDVSPWKSWSLQMGMRHETSSQRVRTYNYTDPSVDSSLSVIEMNDFLPAYGVVWKPTDKIRARLTYSETLARPDFREMSPVGFTDDETGYIVSGNPNLKGTVIKNIDHRWEYYFTTDEYASVGVFYKNFENPIEAVFLSGPNRIQSFQNALAATNYGIELEGRIGARHFSRALRRFTLLSNLSLIQSEIEISPESASSQTSDSRPLQGQSPFVVNLQLQYDRPLWGFSTTLLYNMIGKRITEVGVNGIPDTFEQPFGQLDLVATQKIQDNWTLSFRARNLLNPSVQATQGSEIVRSVRRGRAFAVVLGGVF